MTYHDEVEQKGVAMSCKALSERILNRLSTRTDIDMNYREIYAYALEKYIAGLINTIIFAAVAFPLHIPLETVVFFAFYAPLRKYAGGIHARTRVQCTILSLIILVVLINTAKLICKTEYWFMVAVIVLIFTIILVFLFAPVDSEKRRLSVASRSHYRSLARRIVLSEGFLILLGVGLLPSLKQYIMTAVMALFISGIFIVPYNKITLSQSE
jgi:accessory gene regulator B